MKSVLPKQTEEFFSRLQNALPHSGQVSPLYWEVGEPVEVPLCIHSAALGTTGLHRAYFGDRGFAKRVYQAQLSYFAGQVANVNAQYRAERTPRPNISQRVLVARAQAEKELSNVG